MMKFGIHTRKRFPYRRGMEQPRLIFSIACMMSVFQSLYPTASSLLINPTLINNKAFPSLMRMDTKLKNKHDNNAADDFASFNNYDQEEDESRRLAREFYQELEYRKFQSSLESNLNENKDETYTVRGGEGTRNPSSDDGSKNTIRTVKIRANGNNRRPFTSEPSAQESSPVFPLFPFFSFPAPAPRPATSAGLFSGSGATVYSSGRSIRAEIEILETTMKNNDAKNNKQGGWDSIYVGNPEQLEEVLKLVAVSLIVLSAGYIAVEASGGMMELISWDGAAASSAANHVISLMNDAVTKDGMSSLMLSMSNGDVSMGGEDVAWLMKESPDLAASIVEAVRSVEELVLI
mmetsp:Transcript_32947/g.69352  ORF Transcript_32947/g.69352 Transcript_32947/m.69352 type:complete len:348 (+) Transcript_32947:151-1194(+)|eukprot:CAMPEP_0172299730 /NCGR_PEP_ID=MMETSP1058-20130122/1969_1 /TAXON_ID=83371 /ORGANISM="Detonula confervacea, Strain CCMP 353" /LENGTH=347 /DNA_ID=CAMNT_0013009285 /DNA_START=69 /DNA_END=1115 /DNA_ORIENTATION=+